MSTNDFFRSRLDQMIDLRHPLAVLATRLPWAVIEAAVAPKLARQALPAKRLRGEDLLGAYDVEFGGGVSPAGRPRLPIRLMASLLYLKNSFNLSDEELVERWAENVQWQFFSGMDYYEPRLPCDATQIGRFRRLLGEDGIEQLLKATIETAVEIKAVRPADLERVIVDSTVQSKAIAHPVDSRLLEIARHKVVGAAKRAGINLKQTYAQEGKTLRRKAGGYAHAKQFNRYVFTGCRSAPTNPPASGAQPLCQRGRGGQPVGATATGMGRGIRLGGAVLAMKACTALCMNSHRLTPWRRQVS
jgi:IS5 family transposase